MTVSRHEFGAAAPLYPFTTENLSGALGPFEFADKAVLAVFGSGDHALNAFFLGAKSIDSFDINARTLFFAELKFAALKTLSRKSFLDFFTVRHNAASWDHAVYSRLRRNVSAAARVFFDSWYRRYQNSGALLRDSPLFTKRQPDRHEAVRRNPYLASDCAYRQAASRAREKAFAWNHCPLNQVPQCFPGRRFDVVLLSNLADYLPEIFPGAQDPLAAFARFLADLKPLLNPGGKILAAYLYDTGARERHGAIDDPQARRRALGGLGLDYAEHGFAGAFKGQDDAAAMLTLADAFSPPSCCAGSRVPRRRNAKP